MRHEKIIKRDDGSYVMITVELYVDFMRNEFKWSHGVATKGKRKKTWIYRTNDNVTEDEILCAKLELWELIKPQENK